MGRGRGRLAPVLGALALLAAVGALVFWLQRPPSGPQPVAWDREACAHCRMHVGEPRFAAQLHTRGGQVVNFDDPGCLLRYQAGMADPPRAVFFHHLREDRWLPLEQVAFLPVEASPMGYDLGAVDRGAPGAMDLAAAQERVLRQGPGHDPGQGQAREEGR